MTRLAGHDPKIGEHGREYREAERQAPRRVTDQQRATAGARGPGSDGDQTAGGVGEGQAEKVQPVINNEGERAVLRIDVAVQAAVFGKISQRDEDVAFV